jgi:hypothetical protein
VTIAITATITATITITITTAITISPETNAHTYIQIQSEAGCRFRRKI